MQKHFTFENATIYYTDNGEGQVIILVHGFAEDGTVWQSQTGFLKQHCRVIVPDLPGSGQSEFLSKPNARMEDYAAMLVKLLESENIDNCIMLGHSMGGYITLAFAEAYPNKLKAFGFVHSSAFADSEEKKATRRKGIKMIEEHGAYPFIKTTTPNLFSSYFKKNNGHQVQELIEKGKRFAPEALIQYYNAMMNRPDRTGVLRNSKVPVLFILGSEDMAAPLNDLLQQVHLPTVSVIHILDGVGHMGMWEKPDEVNEYIYEFLKNTEMFH